MKVDPFTLEIMLNKFFSITDEMGITLIRTSYSPNIKERADASCALFDAKGRMISQAEHIPGHLGALPVFMKLLLEKYPPESFEDGDVLITNDPYLGGSHLPDITIVTPVFYKGNLVAFCVNKGHHADVGGAAPSSMAGDTTEIYQEGIRIPLEFLYKRGELNKALLNMILSNVRTPEERLGDLRAQIAANNVGKRRFIEMIEKYGLENVQLYAEEIMNYTERRMRAAISKIPSGTYEEEDTIDEGVRLKVKITIKDDEIFVDFSGSSPQMRGCRNSPLAVTMASVYFVIKCLTDPEVPPNDGTFRPIHVYAPEGSILNPKPPAAVAGGNVEIAQPLCDVLFGALAKAAPDRVYAYCQGTMNNVSIGGIDPRIKKAYTYYETLAGGMGGRPNKDGIDAIHTNRTNTKNTPIEAFEIAYPLLVLRYEIVPDTGGAGKYRGGCGLIREIQVMDHVATVSILSNRRETNPKGLFGGKPGAKGVNKIIRTDGSVEILPCRGRWTLNPGDIISVQTPGGGGYGPPNERDINLIQKDIIEGKVTLESAIRDYNYKPSQKILNILKMQKKYGVIGGD